MSFGKLPTGITGEQVISKLNLADREQVLYACQAKEIKVSGLQGAVEVFAFTNLAIYWMDGKTLAISKKQLKDDILSINFSFGLVGLIFAFEEWALSSVEKSDKKALQDVCEQYYPKLSATELHKARKVAAPEKQQYVEDTYGEIVVTANFGMFKKVSLHSKGYVSGLGSQPEKLIAISGDANVTKKSGLGRGIGAVVTAPLTGMAFSNLDGSNMRGDVYLTIVTDVKTHTIHIDMKNQMKSANPVGEMQKLVTTGEALIKQNQTAPQVATSTQQSAPDLASQLSSLNDLFQSGVLSEEEFNSAKAKILGA